MDSMIPWTSIQLPTKHELHDVWCDGAGLVVVASVDGVCRSTDAGRSWTVAKFPVKSGPLGIAGTAAQLFAVTYENVVRSTDGGASWKKEPAPKAPGLRAVAAAPDGRVWVAGDRGLLARSADGTWTMAATGKFVDVWFSDEVWAVGERELLHGDRLVEVARPSGRRAFAGAGAAVIAFADYAIELSRDAGKTWTKIATPKQAEMYQARTFGELYLTDRNGALWKQAGKSWTQLREADGAQPRALCAAGDRLYAVTHETLLTTPSLDVVANAPVAAQPIADDERTLEALLAQWRTSRSPALADRIDALSDEVAEAFAPIAGDTERARLESWLERAEARRAGELGRLLADAMTGDRRHVEQRVAMLASWPADPRIGALVAREFATPTFTGENARRLWEQLAEVLVATGDVRALPTLDAIVPAKRDRSYLMRWFARSLPELRGRLAATKVVEVALPAAGKKKPSGAAALLDAIYAGDDAARTVYADLLVAKGDPRGELIQLQLADADRPRQAKLLKAHARTWLGDIEPVVLVDGLVFERGFPAACRAQAKVAQVARQMVGKREWRTLHSLDLTHWQDASWLELIRPLSGLRTLTGVHPELVDVSSELPYTTLGLRGRDPEAIVATRALPHLEALELRNGNSPLGDLAPLWKRHGKLARIALDVSYDLEDARLFAQLSAVKQLRSFSLDHYAAGWSYDATRVGAGWHVVADFRQPVGRQDPFDLLAADLARMPRVSKLEVRTTKPLGDDSLIRRAFPEIYSR